MTTVSSTAVTIYLVIMSAALGASARLDDAARITNSDDPHARFQAGIITLSLSSVKLFQVNCVLFRYIPPE